MTANVNTMAYVGRTPWHGLGANLTDGQPIETWLREAGMAYELLTATPQFDFNGTTRDVEGKAIIYRSDNGNPISIMSDRYKIVQPSEVLEFFRDLTDDMGYKLETAGVLGGGEKYWALANSGRSADIGNSGDMIGDYVLLATSADGSMATSALRTSVRVVCQNTLSLATRGNNNGVRISHRSVFDPTDVKSRMGLIDPQAWTHFVADIDKLIATPVDPTKARDFWLAVQDIKPEEISDMSQHKRTRMTNDLRAYAETIRKAPGQSLETADHTLWGLVNAITYQTDHTMRARSDENRLNSAWFGAGDKLKQRAFDIACNMADGATVVEASRILEPDGTEVIEEVQVETPARSYVDEILAGMIG